MVINNALINGKLKSIIIENGKIAEIAENRRAGSIDAGGNRVIPGLIDVHSHGYKGLDTMDANFEEMCRIYAENGTTSWLPTTMTMDYDALKAVSESKTDFRGANILGFHFEGPYISPKYKGAQNEAYIKNPDIKEFETFKRVKLVTVAPELPGALEFINKVSKTCVVSLGHTDCDCETALSAIENGACCLTHMYNAMPPLHHRNAGPIGAAVEKQIYAQLICDGFHISKPAVLAAYKMFGPQRLILISDSIRPAGMPDGEYDSGGLKVTVRDGTLRLADGTIAGSYATLWECVKQAVRFGIPFDDALQMASAVPAKMLKVKKGKIQPGYDADLLITDERLNILEVIIGGEIFKSAV